MNNLNVKMQGKNQFIDDIWAHLKAFKPKLNLFAGQLAKNDLSHFSRLNSIPSVNEEKLKNYEDGLKKLHFELERRFQDFSAMQTELDIFTMPFNVNCEAVRSDLQLELIEFQSNNHLKQSFLNMPKLEFYKSLSKTRGFQRIGKHMSHRPVCLSYVSDSDMPACCRTCGLNTTTPSPRPSGSGFSANQNTFCKRYSRTLEKCVDSGGEYFEN
ncbi:General transcription factor II-I repeat domain-containing protein 2 [Araneus ventricosus]|uniref:General transcription factor II-I repeat domain-containing protein 2 n=1 Tax=Araneus ventricosus TaxID=182803 RepID=A0A4Y2SWE3_ARAVE|nr:General transcription factor II-I repeat domain-containing protein 2 [Araneus ventricosus]